MTATFSITQSPDNLYLYLYPDGDYTGAGHSRCTAFGFTDHYDCVDDTRLIPDDDEGYLWCYHDSCVTEMFTLQDHTTETGTINYVKIVGRVKASPIPVASTASYRLLAHHSGTTSRLDCNVSTTYSNFTYTLTSTPSGGDWNWTAIDDLQIGFDGKSPSYYGYSLSARFNPGGIGVLTEWYGNTYHWQQVDDPICDYDDTFIWQTHSTTGYVDAYTATHYSGAVDYSGVIQNITVTYVTKHTDPMKWFKGQGGVRDASGNWQYGDANVHAPMDSTWKTKSHVFPTAYGGAAWTWTDVANMQLGIRGSAQANTSYNIYCSQLYAVVNYLAMASPQFNTTQLYAIVNYTPSASTCYLNKPQSYTYSNNRNVYKKNLWNRNRLVYDLDRASKSLVLNGAEFGSTATSRLNCVTTMKDYGTVVTLSGFDDELVNGNWLIQDFTYSQEAGNTMTWNWTLSLEKET